MTTCRNLEDYPSTPQLDTGVILCAPTILFFAFTGGLQMFGLHETSRGSSYVPPAILVHLSQLHKKGTFYLARSGRPPQPVSDKPDGDEARRIGAQA